MPGRLLPTLRSGTKPRPRSTHLRSDEVTARATTFVMKHKAAELHPTFFGPIPPPHSLQECNKTSQQAGSLVPAVLARRRHSVRAVTRKGQKPPRGVGWHYGWSWEGFEGGMKPCACPRETVGGTRRWKYWLSRERLREISFTRTYNMDEIPV